MKKATSSDKERILQFLKVDVDNCIYMYIDLLFYDFVQPEIDVWIHEKEEIELVVLRYYDSFQIYSRSLTVAIDPIVELIRQKQVKMISGPKWLVEKIAPDCPAYETTYGSVFRLIPYEVPLNEAGIEVATKNDAVGIAQLLFEDKEFAANYQFDTLVKQLEDRIETKAGRSLIIRRNGNIVAHVATYAECEGIAVISGSIVKKEYREENLFTQLNDYCCSLLHSEGRCVYSFATNRRMIKLMRYCHIECGLYGKLVKVE